MFSVERRMSLFDRAWAKKDVNIVTIVAWAGVGKSTLVNHWLRRLTTNHYRSAELVFGWSFYRQGTSGGTSSADEFLDATLGWFGDPDPRIGTAWEKGERLAKLVALRRTLLVLDGLEPLQNPLGPQEGQLREPSIQAFLRELAAFNTGLCVITTQTPVADIADREGTSALRRELEPVSSDAGAKLLQTLGVTGDEGELRTASEEFTGHCLALTLLGSYLTDPCNGDIRPRKEVYERLAHDVRQGVHARKVMESYQTWFGEGPELSVLRLLGLFDRPVDEKALGVLLKSPAIPGLTESLTHLSPTEWRTVLGKLRRARLLAREDVHNPGCIDTHPLVREYFGEQLRSQLADAWKESNRRLYNHYRTAGPQSPDTFRDVEPLFLGKQVHFRCAIQGQETQTVQGTTQSVDGETIGIATQFGQLSFNYELTVNLTSGTGTGSAQLQAANGEIIYTTIAGQFEMTSTPDVGSITEINTITGGTGRFAGVHGNFTMERLLNLAGTRLQQTVYFTTGWFHGTYYFPGRQAVE
jgi:hypothetical protein